MKTTFIYLFTLLMITSGGKVFAQTDTGRVHIQLVSRIMSISNKIGGEITRKELLNAKGLVVDKAEGKITEFKMTVVNAGSTEEFAGTGNKLSAGMRNAITNASPHAKIIFDNIKCVDKEDKIHTFLPANFELK